MTVFHINELDRRYAFIDDLSDEFLDLVMRQTSGTLEERTEAVATLRAALLEGRRPPAKDLAWPAPQLREEILKFLGSMGFPRLCKDQPEIVDELLKDVLKLTAQMESELPRKFDETFRKLHAIALERLKEEQAPEADKKDEREGEDPPELSPEKLKELRKQAEVQSREELLSKMFSELRQVWSERVSAWKEVLQAFGTLSGLLGRGLDDARALVRSQGWADIARLRELMETLPQLTELIETLGRMQVSDNDEPSVMETIFESICQRHSVYEEIRTPLAPMETRGVRRSNDLSRLLPIEAVNLTRPHLRKLFYARMHEHSLATYLVDGVMAERVETEEDIEQSREVQAEKPPKKRGPIIVCLDTSGSMHGTPETVANALTLEAMRVGFEENRPCYLIAFSGSGQIETCELSLERDRLATLMNFLQRSFHGGTDLVAPINKATDLLEDDNWNKADILLVSDGVFAVPDTLLTRLDTMRDEIGLQVFGVLIANRDASSMARLCDEVHQFDRWVELSSE